MLPTFACGVEEALKHDIEATMASVHAFNLWLDEDWGFDRPDHRIIAAPMISLADPDKAVEEVEFVLGRGAKHRAACVLRRCPAWSSRGRWAIRCTTRCGPGWPRPGCRWSSTCATAAISRSPHVGRQGDVRGVRQEGSARSGAARRSRHPRHDGLDDRARGLRPPPEAEGRQHRERLLLRLPLGQAAEEGRQHSAVALHRGSGRAAAATTCGSRRTTRRT